MDTQPFKGVVEVLHEGRIKPGAVRILKAEDEGATLGFCEKVIKKGGPDAADMLKPRRGGRVTIPNLHSSLYGKYRKETTLIFQSFPQQFKEFPAAHFPTPRLSRWSVWT